MAENFSARPYFDDYSEKKGFHKILFKPSVSVQARELNQLQEILQQQIARVGTHLFKNGSRVVNGQSKLNDVARYVILDGVSSGLENKKISQEVDGNTLTATVVYTEALGGKTLAVVQYLNSATKQQAGDVVNVTAFTAGATLTIEGESTTMTVAEKGPNNEPATGNAVYLAVESGVFYIDGYFVYTEAQKTLISWNEKTINKKAGFVVKKSFVSAYDDASLFDNALGSPNESAEGADRFAIHLELGTHPLDAEVADFIEMVRFENNNLRVAKLDVQYNTLEETLARRTYDESGDYTVRGLEIRVTDHLKDERNPYGFKTKADGGSDNLLAVEVSDGKAYVKGYENENYAPLYLEVKKPRDPDSVKVTNNVIQSNENGEFVYLAAGNQFVDISKHPVLWLTVGVENTSEIMGYCVPKYIDAISISGQTIFKLYGSFYLSQSSTYGWQHLGGWKIDDLKNGPILQRLTLSNVVSTFSVTDGLPLTSHQGYTPYAWDGANRQLYVKKARTAQPFDKSLQVVKAPASGYVAAISQLETLSDGAGDLIKLSVSNVKTTKDGLGNFELTTDMGFTTTIRTNAQGYGVYDHLGNGIFTGRPIAAHTTQDNAYFSNIVNIENNGKRLVINNVAYPNAVFAVSAKLNKAVAVRSKTIAEGFTLIEKPSGREIALTHKDVYRIKNIFVSKDTKTAPVDTDTDVAEYYTLVNNDTLDFYQNTLLKAKGGFATPKGQMKVVYEYFLHGAGEAFTVDSYESLKDNPVDENDVTHIGRIPSFSTKEKSYNLSDYLDFRQQTRDGFFILKGQVTDGSNEIRLEHDYSNVIKTNSLVAGNGFAADTKVSGVDSEKLTVTNNSTYTGTAFIVVNASSAASANEPFASSKATWSAVSGESIIYDASYFVERWDRVVMYKSGEIRYVYGVAGVQRYPDVPVDAMSLATLIVPPYTKQAAFVQYKKDDNKRYTMRDIGKLERRIENLEYYTTLTLKELETKDMKVTDTEGLDRFKSGFFVSDFNDFGVFSPFDGGFKATLVPERQMVIPKEYSDAITLKMNQTSSTNFTIKGDTVFLPYASVEAIKQPYATATETINPYLVVKWNPETRLYPASDIWAETNWAPSVTNIHNITNVQSTFNTVRTESTNTVESSRSVSMFLGWAHSPRQYQYETQKTSVNTEVSYQSNLTSVTSRNEQRTNNLLGTSIIPFMRSRIVKFVVKGAKPNTRYYAQFDAVDVNQFCRIVGANNVAGPWGQPLVSDPMGDINGEFQIPPATFSTGSKTFSLTDADVLANPDAGVEVETNATYTAQGTLRTMQEVIDVTNTTTHTFNVTRVENRVTTVHKENVTVNNTNIRRMQAGKMVPGDPLAQSFFTNDVVGAGMYATKIDLFFAKKDDTHPVMLELREMKNGYPVNDRIKGSLVSVNPADVKVSADSTVATTFEFDKPVWLESGKEYCMVVFGDTSRYHVWISRMGEKVVNEQRIVGQQPSMGSLFKSQNSSTWTPFQLEDLKFTLHRAKFNTAVSGDWNFENNGVAARRKSLLSEFRTTTGSRFVTLKHENHGLQVNDLAKITREDSVGMESMSPDNRTVFNGIPMSDIYGSHIVKGIVDIDHYTIEVTTPAAATGYFEDVGRYVYVEGNINYYAFRMVADEFIPPNSEIRYYANLITGKDYDGGQTPKVKLSEFQIKNNDNNMLQEVCLVQTTENETSKSMVFRAAVQTTNDYVSPTMKLEENHCVVSSLALNKPDSDRETDANGTGVSSKIVTQVIRLKTAADTLRIFTSENKLATDDIEVYYRTDANRSVEERSWTKVNPITASQSYDTETFTEHERRVEKIPEFNEFQIKVVFKGTNSVRRPALKEIRAIAVAG